jgi:hypothetical protein
MCQEWVPAWQELQQVQVQELPGQELQQVQDRRQPVEAEAEVHDGYRQGG